MGKVDARIPDEKGIAEFAAVESGIMSIRKFASGCGLPFFEGFCVTLVNFSRIEVELFDSKQYEREFE